MVQHCFSARVRPVLGIPIPTHEPVSFPLLGCVDMQKAFADYAALRQWLRVLAHDFALQRVDFAQAFADWAEGTDAAHTTDALSALYTDGLHPSAAGHEIMASLAY